MDCVRDHDESDNMNEYIDEGCLLLIWLEFPLFIELRTGY